MKNHLRVVPVALLLGLSSLASAGGLYEGDAPAPFAAHEWSAPIAQSFAKIGTDRIAGLGVPVLSNLADVVLARKTGDGQIFARLSYQLQRQHGYTPAAFVAMSADEKIAALKEAAQAAGAVADNEADQDLQGVPQRWSDEQASELQGRIDALAADAAYLSQDRRERVSTVLKSISSFKKARQEAFETWMRDTPSKIAAGAFDGANHIVKTEEGWRIGEHSPRDKAYPTYAVAFQARLAEIGSLPAGPGKTGALKELSHNLHDPRIGEQARAEGADIDVLTTQLALSKFSAYSDPYADKRAVDAARRAYTKSRDAGRALGDRATVTFLKRYDLTSGLLYAPINRRWRVLAGIVKGDAEAGYPSFAELDAARTAADKRLQKRGWAGLGVFMASYLGLMIAAGLKMTTNPAVGWPLFVLFLTSLAYFLVQFLRKNAVGRFFGPGYRAKQELDRVDFTRQRKSGIVR